VEVTPQDPSVQWVLKVLLEMMVRWVLRDLKGFRVMMDHKEFLVLKDRLV
jgi:hypothetical protein